MKRVRILIAAVLSVISNFVGAQDINLSQFYEVPLLRNPSLAGLFNGDIRISGAHRNQWSSVTVPYSTQALGADLKFTPTEYTNSYLALGLQVLNDVAGDSRLGKTQIQPVLAYHQSLSDERDMYLSLGVMGGPTQQRFDPSKLAFDDQFVNGAYSHTNPTSEYFTNTNITYWDISLGMLFSTTVGENIEAYVGGSYFHLNQPKVAFSPENDIRLNRKWMVNAGLSIPMSEYNKIVVYTDLFKQGGNFLAQGGLMYKHDLTQLDDEAISFSLGSFLRWNDAIIPMIKLDYYNFGVGLTYDVNISKLNTASQYRGGFEVSLSYRSFLNIRNSSLNKLRCPVAF